MYSNVGEAEQKSYLCHPKRIYEEKWLFVLSHEALFNQLNASCKNICKLKKNALTMEIYPVHYERNGADFISRAISRIEGFLDLVMEKNYELDSEKLALLVPSPDWFLKLQKDMSERASITVDGTTLLVQGLPKDVKQCFSEFHENVWKAFNTCTKQCPRDMCRVLVYCGVIERLNDMFDGKVEVSCNIQDERVDFIGEISHVEEVEREMQKMKLNQKSPKLTGLKLELLKTILPKDEVEEVIYARFRESGVRGGLLIKDDQLDVIAADEENFRKACAVLDKLIHMKRVASLLTSVAETLRDFLTALVQDLSKNKDILVKIKDNVIWVVGLSEENVRKTTSILEKAFKDLEVVSEQYLCSADIAQHIIKFSAKDKKLPPDMISVTKLGLQLLGPRRTTLKVLQHLKSKNILQNVLTLSEIGLAKYLACDSWKDFVNSVEDSMRCSVSVKQVKGEEGAAREAATPSKTTPQKTQACQQCTAKLSSLIVKLCQEDVSCQRADVTVNGVVDDPVLPKESSYDLHSIRSGLPASGGAKLKYEFDARLFTSHSIDDYQERIKTILNDAERLAVRKITLPIQGDDIADLDDNALGSEMVRALESFASGDPSSVKEVQIVVFDELRFRVFKKHLKPHLDDDEKLFRKKLQELQERSASSPLEDVVELSIISESNNAFVQAEQMIRDHLNASRRKVISDPVIARLGPNDVIDIHQSLAGCHASIEIDKQLSCITIFGLLPNFGDLLNNIRDVLYELGDAEKLSHRVIWKWKRHSSQFSDLPLRVSRSIEDEFRLNPRKIFTISLYGELMQVSLPKLTYNFKKFTGYLRRDVLQ